MEYSQKKFDFSAFQNFQKGQYAHIPQEFLEWFVGFFEGDGSLIINHRNELNFVIPQDTKDVQILEKIQNTLGFGNVLPQGPTTSRYSVHNLGDLYKLLLILNGNICLPSRIKGLSKFVTAFNEKVRKNKRGKYVYLNEIPLSSLPCIPSIIDAWFSGFIDAEGCFTLSFLKASSTYRIRMLVAQKGEENLPLLSHFILMFQTGSIEKHSKQHVYRYVVSGLKNCKLLSPYFQKFPLFTKKAKSYIHWCEVMTRIEKGNHLNEKNLFLLIEKAKQINK
ncbi:aI5 (mitochondrion) [Scenedesmus sp. PABB004]|nr:aI5 [Scenedesmus sp. PABB004]